MVFTVISRLFPPAERGRIQGLFSGMFGLASIVGPLLGGYLTDNLSWRWVFYVNLPVGLIALAVLWFALPRHRDRVARDQPDRLPGRGHAGRWRSCRCCWRCRGAAASTLGLAADRRPVRLRGGHDWRLPAGRVARRRADHPARRCSRTASSRSRSLALVLMAIGMFGTILFIPLFIQGVIGTSATQSGTVHDADDADDDRRQHRRRAAHQPHRALQADRRCSG